MGSLSKLNITQPYIALFGSGNSVKELSAESFAFIKSQAFVITLNYAPIHLKGHMNMWSDLRVSQFLEDYYKDRPKDLLFSAPGSRVRRNYRDQIDYLYSPNGERLKGNYTIVWVLQLLKKYFPEKIILLFGVDMYNEDAKDQKWYDHYTDFDKQKRGTRYNLANKLNQCARQIKRYCASKNIINCNPKSRLLVYEKRAWQSIFPLKILHLCMTPLAGAPCHLSKIINKYSACQSISVLRGDLAGYRNLRWSYDHKRPTGAKLRELIDWADLIHYHRKIYPGGIGQKKSILQFHSPPNRYRPGKTHAAFNGRKMVIAQYHPRFYTDAFIVPNLIDIWDTAYLPGKKAEDRVKIFFSWATEVKGSWSDKGSSRTKRILKKIADKYGSKVEIKVLHNRPYEECMVEKRTAHICLDECVTGSYHLQSLEGCSVGAVTFNNIDEQTAAFMAEVSGQPDHPFVKTDLAGLYDKLCFYIENPEILKEKGAASRKWMEQYWDPRKLVYRYLTAYFDVFLHNKIQENKEPESIVPTPVTSPSIPVVKSSPPSKKYNITELHQQYADKVIYLFGGGPSLFEVNPKDFKDKICFGINYAFEVMPYIDYHFVHVIETYEAIRKVVDNRKLILPETLVRQWYRERGRNRRPHRIKTENEQAYIYPIQNPYERRIHKKHLSLDKEAAFFTWSTTTHSAIHAAAYMGATTIYLIGVDYCLYPNGKVHFESKHSPIYGQQNWDTNQKHRQGDEWLASKLQEKSILLKNISRSYADPANQEQGLGVF